MPTKRGRRLATDCEFLDEIIQLIDGTHWKTGDLETTCLIPVARPEDAPEGCEVIEEPLYLLSTSVARKLPKTAFTGDGYADGRRVRCYYKAQYCIVGMVLKIADLHMSEERIEYHGQAQRIVNQIWQNMPEGSKSQIETEDYTGVSRRDKRLEILQRKIEDVEGWNDKSKKEQVREVVVKARDAHLQVL